jgi:hypothetical protein
MDEKVDKMIRDAIAKGTGLAGAADALKENIKQYPTYADLQKRHDERFNVKEKLKNLCLF